jgi:hypothetical protein
MLIRPRAKTMAVARHTKVTTARIFMEHRRRAVEIHSAARGWLGIAAEPETYQPAVEAGREDSRSHAHSRDALHLGLRARRRRGG